MVLLVITLAIAVPILCRGFYYWHIDLLDLEETTGFTREVMVEAFDQMMDYCVLGAEFGTGTLPISADGEAHFADVAALFRLNFLLCGASILLLAVSTLSPLRKRPVARPLGRGWRFWGGIVPVAIFTLLGIAALWDFSALFTCFHQVFFLGKTNWLFDPRLDMIINILPETYFMHCGFLIVGVLLLLSAALAVSDFIKRRNLHDPSTAC